jgi:hypothetical protein
MSTDLTKDCTRTPRLADRGDALPPPVNVRHRRRRLSRPLDPSTSQEAVRFTRFWSGLLSCVFLGLAVPLAWLCWQYVASTSEQTAELGAIAGVCSVAALTGAFSELYHAAKAWLAPNLYLVENFSSRRGSRRS